MRSDGLRYLCEKEVWDQSDAMNFLAQLRITLERAGRRDFGVVKAYCDWALHPRLDKNPLLCRFLVEMTEAFCEYCSHRDERVFWGAVSSVLRPRELRLELVEMAHQLGFDLPEAVRDRKLFSTLWSGIAVHLKDKTIALPSEGAKRELKRISERVIRRAEGNVLGLGIGAFTLRGYKREMLSELSDDEIRPVPEDAIVWEVQTVGREEKTVPGPLLLPSRL